MGKSSEKYKKRSRSDAEVEEGSGTSGDDTSSSRHSDERKRRKHKHKTSSRTHESSSGSRKKHKKRRERSPSPDASVASSHRDRKKASKQKKDGSRKKEDAGGQNGGAHWSRLAESAEERAARKAAKEAKKIASMFGYTSHSNPFGDANLHQQFVWKAKEQQQASKKGGREGGKEVGEKKVSEAERRLELVREIEKVRKRREEREKEQEEMERLRAEEARLREAGNYEEWERKEEEFHLEQARVRSKVRTQGREGREGNEEGGMGERWGCGGWDWNMYNRTHYDHDNPPPKTVQGYKFNVFYPDLIDKTKAPTFFMERCDNPEFTIIRFHAGPPYEDVAFKILNKEWEKSHKRGFKCLFERGILSLYFNFKRARYRR
ncbi:hypothetical protein NSK_002024 [Nannochloropsis salina CCMP1776]|uniref:Splicing factor Cactin n=2 Tax=Monodopsidaceae TaxID=425072 RepID=A0A4D9D6D0_9STRA|nr:hypothetical protein NSK_002024 [Nannochloropsis salina CCMP1776]|eukprot:TFJ86936.1 hypothetical protein NSK_002024 [Nannochloropsis salina CCMP1776]